MGPRLVLMGLAFFGTVAGARAQNPPLAIPEPVMKARASVALVEVQHEGRLNTKGSAFVTAIGGKLVLVTAAHVVRDKREGETVSVYLPEYGEDKAGDAQLRPCKIISKNDDYDLAVLAPVVPLTKTAPIAVRDGLPAAPSDGEKVFVVGSPLGALEPTPHEGVVAAKNKWGAFSSKLVPERAERARLVSTGELPPLRDDLEIVRLVSMATSKGMSGGPTLDASARLIGVHHGIVQSAASGSVCISAKHLAELKPTGNAVARAPQPAPKAVGTVPQSTEGAALAKRLGTDLGRLNCYHNGYVKGNARDVIDGYVQDITAFAKAVSMAELDALLGRTQLAHVTNPGLGFQLLAPKGYMIDMKPMKDDVGLVVTFYKGDKPDGPASNAVRVFVYKGDYAEVVAHAQATKRAELFADIRRKYKLPAPPKLSPLPPDQQKELDRFLKLSQQTQEFKSLFFADHLGLKMDVSRLMAKGPPPKGVAPPASGKVDPKGALKMSIDWKDPGGTIFNEYFHATPGGGYAWSRYNLLTDDDASGHSVSIAANGSVLVVVHYKLTPQDGFNGRDDVGRRAYLERALMARSLALY